MSPNDHQRCDRCCRKVLLRPCVSSDIIPPNIIESQRARLIGHQVPQQPISNIHSQPISFPPRRCECETWCTQQDPCICSIDEINNGKFKDNLQNDMDQCELCPDCYEENATQAIENLAAPTITSQTEDDVEYQPCATMCQGCCANFIPQTPNNLNEQSMIPYVQTETCPEYCPTSIPCTEKRPPLRTSNSRNGPPTDTENNLRPANTMDELDVATEMTSILKTTDLQNSLASGNENNVRSDNISDELITLSEKRPTLMTSDLRNVQDSGRESGLDSGASNIQDSTDPNIDKSQISSTLYSPEESIPVKNMNLTSRMLSSQNGINVSKEKDPISGLLNVRESIKESSQFSRTSHSQKEQASNKEERLASNHLNELYDDSTSQTENSPISRPTYSRNGQVSNNETRLSLMSPNERDDSASNTGKGGVSKGLHVQSGPASNKEKIPLVGLSNEQVGSVSNVEKRPISRVSHPRNGPGYNTFKGPVSKTSYLKNGPVDKKNITSIGLPNVKDGSVSNAEKTAISRISHTRNFPDSDKEKNSVPRASRIRDRPVSDIAKSQNLRVQISRNDPKRNKIESPSSEILQLHNNSSKITENCPVENRLYLGNHPVTDTKNSPKSRASYANNGQTDLDAVKVPTLRNIQFGPVPNTEESPRSRRQNLLMGSSATDLNNSHIVRTSKAQNNRPTTETSNVENVVSTAEPSHQLYPEPRPFKAPPSPHDRRLEDFSSAEKNNQEIMMTEQLDQVEIDSPSAQRQVKLFCCDKDECQDGKLVSRSAPIIVEVADEATSVILVPNLYLCDICSKTDLQLGDDIKDLPQSHPITFLDKTADSTKNHKTHITPSPKTLSSHTTMSQSFGEALPAGFKDEEVDLNCKSIVCPSKINKECPCQFPPAFSVFGCSGKITGKCDCNNKN